MVVLLEGITGENAKPLKEAMKQQPAFSIADPPSSKANSGLLRDFQISGVSNLAACSPSSVVNPNDDSCWEGVSSVVKYDAGKVRTRRQVTLTCFVFKDANGDQDSKTISALIANLERLENFVTNGELEAALVLIPESSRSSEDNSWSSNTFEAGDLRRRESESVLNDGSAEQTAPADGAAAGDALPWALQDKNRPVIPQCFQSQNSCETRTNNCSGGHGKCVDKYGGGAKGGQVCFACHCVPQVIVEGEGEDKIGRTTVKWGGNMCQKKDVSSQFWLIAGFTVTLVGVLSFAIGLLFNVGEERLPGVIGAGVSRAK